MASFRPPHKVAPPVSIRLSRVEPAVIRPVANVPPPPRPVPQVRDGHGPEGAALVGLALGLTVSWAGRLHVGGRREPLSVRVSQ